MKTRRKRKAETMYVGIITADGPAVLKGYKVLDADIGVGDIKTTDTAGNEYTMKGVTFLKANPKFDCSWHWMPLPQRQDLMSHSPDGHNWGYVGSGPSQLAFDMCLDVLGDNRQSEACYIQFKDQHVVTLEKDKGFTWDGQAIEEIIRVLAGLEEATA